jgi:hypothetical protein
MNILVSRATVRLVDRLANKSAKLTEPALHVDSYLHLIQKKN